MLPKGWSMEGKTDVEAALQEAFEEAGVQGTISDAPVGSYAYIKLFEDGSTKPSQAIVFSLQVSRQVRKWPERSQRRRKWVSAAEAAEMVFERDLSRLLSNLAAGRIIV
jgi:8-oxo-dGTP pyrophosphatase MutT (NUDIX family)